MQVALCILWRRGQGARIVCASAVRLIVVILAGCSGARFVTGMWTLPVRSVSTAERAHFHRNRRVPPPQTVVNDPQAVQSLEFRCKLPNSEATPLSRMI